jgi:hypothetical protein
MLARQEAFMKGLGYVAAGAAFGIALVVACESDKSPTSGGASGGGRVSAGSSSHAAPSDCAAWQVAYLEATPVGGVSAPADLPAGWEPFIVYGGGVPGASNIYVRRCKP